PLGLADDREIRAEDALDFGGHVLAVEYFGTSLSLLAHCRISQCCTELPAVTAGGGRHFGSVSKTASPAGPSAGCQRGLPFAVRRRDSGMGPGSSPLSGPLESLEWW